MNSIEITFIIPCYNEVPEVLNNTVGKLQTALSKVPHLKYEIIIINDGSTKYSYPEYNDKYVRLISQSFRKGYGASILSGMSYAQYGWIGIIDADGTYPAELFPELIKHTDKYDMIVGERSWKDIELIKRPPKLILQKLSGFLANRTIRDLNSGMRLFKKHLVEKHVRVFPQGFSFTSTLTMICLTQFYEVKYVDIPYYKRVGLSNIEPVRDTLKFFMLVLRLSLYFNPLRFFIPLSLIIGFLGAVRGLRDILVTNAFGGLTLILFFMAFQVFFFGLIAEIINKK
jgi:glycosyltransferase involved in cell wall biosynthesis